MNAFFRWLDSFATLDYIVAGLLAGGGAIWLAHIFAETSQHRSWQRRKADFAADHPGRTHLAEGAPSLRPRRTFNDPPNANERARRR